MRHHTCLILAVFLLIACASKHPDVGSKKEIAIATQRLGEEYYNAGNYTAALKNLLEAYETIPNDPYLNDSLGLVYLAKNRYDLAETHFKKALDIKPDYVRAKNNLGAAYLIQKKWGPAIQCFEEVSENLLYANPEIPLSNLGWAYFHQNMYATAKKYFEQSLDIRPNFLLAVHGIASIYLETGSYNQAIEFLHRALKKNPGAAILHSDLAKNYERLHDFERAKKSWKIVIDLVPETSPLAKEAQDRLLELK